MRLNIGCGLKRLAGYVNLDSEPSVKPDVQCDLTKRWPFEDSVMTEGVCSHVMEHIGEGFFSFLQEMYRVAAPGAVIKVAVPHPRNDLFLRDPTHVRPILPDMMVMFSKRQCEEEAERGLLLTPFWKILGIDFDISQAYYILDPQLSKELMAEVEKDFRKYERHFNNIVWEIQFELKAVK